MTNRNENEPVIRDQNVTNTHPALARTGEHRELGAFSTSFDEFESLMSALGYRHPISADLWHA